jgi:hypothetical protein
MPTKLTPNGKRLLTRPLLVWSQSNFAKPGRSTGDAAGSSETTGFVVHVEEGYVFYFHSGLTRNYVSIYISSQTDMICSWAKPILGQVHIREPRRGRCLCDILVILRPSPRLRYSSL